MESRALFFVAILSMFIGMSVISCASKEIGTHQGKDLMAAKSIEEVLKEHTGELIAMPGVVGTAQGQCNKEPCIKVFVIKKTPELNQKIPDILDGYPIVIEETGEIRPLPGNRN